jgi:hypothetical protein
VRALLALLAIAALVAFLSFRESGDERRFGDVAGAIAGRGVSVRCQGFFAELVDIEWRGGSVRFDENGEPSDSAFLTRRRCKALTRLADGKEQPLAEAALGVETLAHESYHLAGELNEAVTQCYGLQAMAFVAEWLGATPEKAQAFTRYSWARYPDLPAEYQSSDCRNGGRLDLRPQSDVWP